MLVFVFNCGSSSVRLSLIDTVSGAWRAKGSVDRIGDPDRPGTGKVQRAGEAPRTVETRGSYEEAVHWLVGEMHPENPPEAIGHRVVHGGEEYEKPVVVTPEVLEDLDRLSRLAPLHNPPNVAGIRLAGTLFPDLPQVAVFDTAFHATLPDYAYRYAIPERFYREDGIRRYGFHGTSHRYVSERAAAMLGRTDLRIVTLHLGNGCSVAAVRAGKSLDTSMGMTPLEGLVMGTRSGDLDPSIPLLLQESGGLTAAEVDRILNHEGGLEALSGGLSDMRDIERERAAGNDRARLAFDAFCYRVRKYVGGYAAVVGGLDALVFTAGIGENSAAVRAAVCAGLEFLGLRLDEARNGQNTSEERDISAPDSSARILVIPTNEELLIARDTEAALNQ